MALQVWLPLNRDLHNQGLSNLEITAINTLIFNNNGKIGKCYQRATTDAQITTGLNINNNLVDLLGTQCSIAIWVKPLGTHTHYNGTFISSGNWNGKKWAFGVSQDNSKVDVLCGGYNNYINCPVPVNEWTHLVSTFDNGVSKLYKNGIYIGELTGQAAIISDAENTCIGRETYASGYFGFNGLINDVRIYDHVLSAQEVEEISKGLVLHYQLNNGNPNLLSEYVTPGQGAPGATSTGGRTNYYGKYGIIIPATENADTYFRLFLKQQLVQGTTYTISCYVSGLLPGSYYNFPLFAQGNTSMGILQLNHNGLCSLTFTMNSSSQSAVTTPEGDTVYVCFMDDAGRTLASGQGTITINGFKLEQGNNVTNFSSIDNDIIYDSSGYNNNGIPSGSFEIDNSSAKYNISTLFNGTDNAIQIPFNAMLGLTAAGNTAYSFSCWIKVDTTSSKNWATILGGPSGFEMETKNSSGTTGSFYAYSWGKRNIAYSLGEWHHIAMTNDTSQTIWYLDGEQAFIGTSPNIPIGDYFIGSWKNSSSQNYKGAVNDVRIYATALSADDIKELYKTSKIVNGTTVKARDLEVSA